MCAAKRQSGARDAEAPVRTFHEKSVEVARKNAEGVRTSPRQPSLPYPGSFETKGSHLVRFPLVSRIKGTFELYCEDSIEIITSIDAVSFAKRAVASFVQRLRPTPTDGTEQR